MRNIQTYSDLETYIKSRPMMKLCWYGPRSGDATELSSLINLNGIISCYGSGDYLKATPYLSNEKAALRRKCSSDDLAADLISDGRLATFVNEHGITAILPYDSNPELEEFCRRNGIAYLSSIDAIKEPLRDKTNVDEISRAIGLPTIPGNSGAIEDFDFAPLADKLGLPLFVHFAEGAGGSGNYIVHTAAEFEEVKARQKGKNLNVKTYLIGRSCSIDICVTRTSIICGPLENMMIGADPLASLPTEYVGSSWFINDYSDELRRKACDIGVALGNYLRSQGFLGYFHPDFLIDGENIFLTELNMRFGASCGIYAKAQLATGQIPLMIIHALTFMDPGLQIDASKINEANLKPLNYGLFVLKNNFGKSVSLSRTLKSGIYRIVDDKLIWTGKRRFGDLDHETIFIGGLPELLSDTIIEDGAFICQVVTKYQVADSRSNLNAEGKALAQSLIAQIIKRD